MTNSFSLSRLIGHSSTNSYPFVGFLHVKWGLAQCLGVASSRQTKDCVIGKDDCRYLRPVLCWVLPSAATNRLSLLGARKYDARPPPLLAILMAFSRLGRCVFAGGVKNIHLLLAGFQVEVNASQLETYSSFVDDRPEITYKCIPLKPLVHCSSPPLPLSFLYIWTEMKLPFPVLVTDGALFRRHKRKLMFLSFCLSVRPLSWSGELYEKDLGLKF
jgi:hypothetical protein